jgi:threonine aldolase
MGDECHIFYYESGGAAALGGIPFSLLPNDRFGMLDLERVKKAIRTPRPGWPRSGAICVENTHNRCSGVSLPLDYLSELHSLAQERGVPVHMDGARIFNAAAAIDCPPEEIARHADTIQFCLTKGLAAPVGSMIVGSAEFIMRARSQRKIVGGAMRQSGVIAAAGLVALRTMVERLPEDHRRARRRAEGLAELPGVSVDLEAVQSNIIIFNIAPVIEHTQFQAAMKERGILISNYDRRGLRMVTHYMIDDAAVDAALTAAREIVLQPQGAVVA